MGLVVDTEGITILLPKHMQALLYPVGYCAFSHFKHVSSVLWSTKLAVWTGLYTLPGKLQNMVTLVVSMLPAAEINVTLDTTDLQT